MHANLCAIGYEQSQEESSLDTQVQCMQLPSNSVADCGVCIVCAARSPTNRNRRHTHAQEPDGVPADSDVKRNRLHYQEMESLST